MTTSDLDSFSGYVKAGPSDPVHVTNSPDDPISVQYTVNPSATPMPVGVQGDTLTLSQTRPSNTTPYTIGDVVGSGVIWQFDGAVREIGRRGAVLDAVLVDSANVATLGSFDLMLFDTTIEVEPDNSPFTPADAEMLKFVGGIGFGSPFIGDVTAGTGGNVAFHARNLYFEFECGPATRTLFGVLIARNAYVPISGEVFTIRLKVRWLD